MFEQFKEIDDSHSFEIVENGFVLRVSGRSHDDDWITKSFIFSDDVAFFSAIGTIAARDRS